VTIHYAIANDSDHKCSELVVILIRITETRITLRKTVFAVAGPNFKLFKISG